MYWFIFLLVVLSLVTLIWTFVHKKYEETEANFETLQKCQEDNHFHKFKQTSTGEIYAVAAQLRAAKQEGYSSD